MLDLNIPIMRLKMWLCLSLLYSFHAYAQTQTIRGTVIDKHSEMPLIGVAVVVQSMDDKVTETDLDGNFVIEDVPVGRVNLLFTSVQMKPVSLTNVQLLTGKELVLNITMEDDVEMLETVVLTTKNKRRPPKNVQALVSSRQVAMEEVNKYAGSLNDVSRMVMNFAGVAQTNDSNNDIVIRGNSPKGLLWRLNGLDIPNPNHFGSGGATGGPVSMLNSNMLANSDFYMSAFVPEYGNATSGVFDLKLRKGNVFQHEFLGQVGVNGFEFMAEGPIQSEKSSYLVSYRYSLLGVASAIGLSFGTGRAVPNYQDLTFNFHLPVGEKGRLSIWGMGGKSDIHFEKGDDDNTYVDRETTSQSQTGVVGINYRHQWTDHTFSESVLGVSGIQSEDRQFDKSDAHTRANNGSEDYYKSDFQRRNIEWVNSLKVKLAKGSHLKAVARVKYQQSIHKEWNTPDVLFKQTSNLDKGFMTAQTAVSFFKKWTNAWRTTIGFNSQYFSGNEKVTFEPRISTSYDLNKSQSLNLGYGYHTQQPDLGFLSFLKPDGTPYNESLDFTRSHHGVLGYQWVLSQGWRLKLETYFQYITNATIAVVDPTNDYTKVFSGLNNDSFSVRSADFRTPKNLTDGGKGRNYGVELTLEKFLDKGFYFLATTSLFKSEFKAQDNMWRNTVFANNHVSNLSVGKEFAISERRKLTIDLKGTYAGGLRRIPIHTDKANFTSANNGYDFGNAYNQQIDDYYRADLRIGYKLEKETVSQEWAIDIRNVTNRKNIFSIHTDPNTQKDDITYQQGIFPVGVYRIYF